MQIKIFYSGKIENIEGGVNNFITGKNVNRIEYFTWARDTADNYFVAIVTYTS